jgi:hypothetical protein
MNFPTNPMPSLYSVRSKVSTDLLKQFLSALKGESIEVTKSNLSGFSSLCSEFGFELKSPSYRLTQVEVSIEELKNEMKQLSNQMTEIQGLPSLTTQLSESFTQLQADVSMLKKWTRVPESEIVSDFSDLFSEFRGKHFEILWRGSSDGFKVKEFHRRCDGHKNTVTVILDTEGNIFGGFTPVEWESGEPHYKADNTQKSFLFTVKNPHNIPRRRFMLKEDKKSRAIFCCTERGPYFRGGLLISDNCNINMESWTQLGDSYPNDTGLDKNEFFTGSYHFQVKEIEVFEITN